MKNIQKDFKYTGLNNGHILDVSKLFYDFFMQYDKIFLQLIKKN